MESICTDEKVVEANLAEKVRLSPDFKGMDFSTAVKDLKQRISNYEAVYESVGEDEKVCVYGIDIQVCMAFYLNFKYMCILYDVCIRIIEACMKNFKHFVWLSEAVWRVCGEGRRRVHG